MNYETVELDEKIIVGLTGRTGNTDPDCQKIIGGLWQDFMAGGVSGKVKNKANSYCVGLYSGYDFNLMTYDVTVGCEVTGNDNPELSERVIPAGRYAKFHVKGDVVKDVSDAWETIWVMPLERSFTGDFEEYTGKEGDMADVDIYVALK